MHEITHQQPKLGLSQAFNRAKAHNASPNLIANMLVSGLKQLRPEEREAELIKVFGLEGYPLDQESGRISSFGGLDKRQALLIVDMVLDFLWACKDDATYYGVGSSATRRLIERFGKIDGTHFRRFAEFDALWNRINPPKAGVVDGIGKLAELFRKDIDKKVERMLQLAGLSSAESDSQAESGSELNISDYSLERIGEVCTKKLLEECKDPQVQKANEEFYSAIFSKDTGALDAANRSIEETGNPEENLFECSRMMLRAQELTDVFVNEVAAALPRFEDSKEGFARTIIILQAGLEKAVVNSGIVSAILKTYLPTDMQGADVIDSALDIICGDLKSSAHTWEMAVLFAVRHYEKRIKPRVA